MIAHRTRLLVATTIPETAWTIMAGQLKHLRTHGFDVVLVSSPGQRLTDTAEREGICTRAVPMRRELSLRSDLTATLRLIRIMRSERIDISYVGTPKAGLLAGIAAVAARVPKRIYLLRGLRLDTETGWRRVVLWVAEWLAIHAAHQVVVVSPSLCARARELRLLGRSRGVVIGRGASNGVDTDKLAPTAQNRLNGRALRESLGVPVDAFVFGFVGRITADKGIAELVEAFRRVQLRLPDTWLVVAGSEELAGLPARTGRALAELPNVRFTGWLDDSTPAYHAMDCLVLPTYREGMPNTPLEAAAAGKAVITTSAVGDVGAVDSIVDGSTGILVTAHSARELSEAMSSMATDPMATADMGRRGQAFVAQHYSNRAVWDALVGFLGDGSADRYRGSRHLQEIGN